MNTKKKNNHINSETVGTYCYEIAKKLFPIFRSITGKGFRHSLEILKEELPEINVFEVPSGTQVFDWTVPREWDCTEAYIEDENHKRIIDFKKNNLHVLGYSAPFDKVLPFSELKQYIYTQEDLKDAIPYVTSYYCERSGFCMSQNLFDELSKDEDRKYHAVIKSSFNEKGSLTYGECIIRGKSDKEILISTYLCHPSMANNECSGPALSVALAKFIKEKPRYYTYRFIYIPETIGSITYLSRNLEVLKKNTVAGFVISCVGDNRDYSFVKTRYGNTLTDKVLENTLKYLVPSHKAYSFFYRGSDERQFNAPGVDLPVCSVSRTKYGSYPEYHTSKDDLTLISPEGFTGAYEVMTKCLDVLENNFNYKLTVLCEPQLGKRGLYPTVSQKGSHRSIKAMRDFIAYADGTNDLIDISDIINVPAYKLVDIKELLMRNNIIKTTVPI